MKKVFVFLLILVLISAFTISFSNSNISEVIEIYRNTIKIEVNGEEVITDNFLLNGIIGIKYTIDGHRIIQEKVEKAMLDSKFNKITLIQTPLLVGNLWQEEVVDKVTTLKSFIQKVEIVENGFKQYNI